MNFESVPEVSALKREEQLSAVTFWGSRFNFLMAHNGLRPARVHWLLGTTGSGKTSLMSSIIADSAAEYPVLVILTEETVNRYAPNILKASPKLNQENLKFISEREIPASARGDQKKLITWLETRIVEAGVRLVFWDNITTSSLFSQRFGNAGQEETVLRIRDLAESLEVAFFIAIHTEKKVTDNMGRLIMGEDVRGTQQSFIGADFFYILQRFEVGNVFYPFIRTVKHRGYEPKDKIHLLHFGNGIYIKDTASNFDKMNEVFCHRNVLGKQKKTRDE